MKKEISASLGIVCLFCFAFTGAAQSPQKMVRVGIMRTSPPYAVEQEEGLKQGMAALGYIEGKNIFYLPTVIVQSDVKDYPANAEKARKLAAQGIDVMATIGTQASVPVWPAIKASGVPMVFAGVTYPIQGNLIEAFGKPTGGNISGISYGVPTITRLELFRKLFPDTRRFKKIAFVYCASVPQEALYVQDLKSLKHTAGWEIVCIDSQDEVTKLIDYDLLIGRLTEEKPDIVFGWFSLDQILGDTAQFKKLQFDYKKPILGIVSKHTDEGAIGGVLTDHIALGFQQARIIDRILKGENPGRIPPEEPKEYLIEINLRKAKELDVDFDLDILAGADRIVR